MIASCKQVVGLAGLLIATTTPATADIPAFFFELVTEYASRYDAAERSARPEADFPFGVAAERMSYLEVSDRFGVAAEDSSNHALFLRLSLLHDLLTGDGASNCISGGILHIPYFWHWLDPNPRHEILLLPDSVRAVDASPPPPFQRYQSRADIDRTPSLYLTDLVSEEPGYWHPYCGAFYTFGWCSEREMAFVAIVTAWGLPAKVVQRGIHTWSEVWCTFVGEDGQGVDLIAEVDNTFDTVNWSRSDGTLEAWQQAIGSGSTIGWYNRTARSEAEIAALRETPVSSQASTRIRSAVADWCLAAGGR